jgi:hypothetical protein
MFPVSRKDACAFIDELRINNGGITKEDREWLEQRPQVLRSHNSLRKQLGASTRLYENLLMGMVLLLTYAVA